MRLPRLRFTVRRLMVVVAGIAALLGSAAWYAKLAHRQQRAVMLVRSRGGLVLYGYVAEALEKKAPLKPPFPSWLSRALGDDYLDNVAIINLSGTGFNDTEMQALKGLKRLYRLNLRHTPVTDAGLDHLKDLTGLQELYLHGPGITDSRVTDLQGSLRQTKIIRGCPCDRCFEAGCVRAARCSTGARGFGPPPAPARPAPTASAPRS
jgi:hypothetical protein